MKRKTYISSLLLVVLLLSAVLSACSSAKKAYLGTWYGYKLKTDSFEMVFSDISHIAKMELVAEINSDNTYTFHSYVNGKEGDKYPKTGKFEMDGDKIVFPELDGYGEIVDGELVLYFEDGELIHYYRSEP